MPAEPTPTEIEAGARALERLVAEHPRADRRTVARWVLRAVLPDHDARVRAEVAEEIPGWTHEQDVTYDGDTHWLECAWCNAPVTPIKAGDSLEQLLTAARDHHRTCAHLKVARAHATTEGDHRAD